MNNVVNMSENQGTNIQKKVIQASASLKMLNFLFIRKLTLLNGQFHQINAVIMSLQNLKSPIRDANCII